MTKQKREEPTSCCPYCDEEIKAADLPWCQACGVVVVYCSECGEVIPQDKKVCPHCGAEVRGEGGRGGSSAASGR